MSSLSMASRNLRRRKARTILTVSGIVVDVALIMVLLAITEGTATQTNGLAGASSRGSPLRGPCRTTRPSYSGTSRQETSTPSPPRP